MKHNIPKRASPRIFVVIFSGRSLTLCILQWCRNSLWTNSSQTRAKFPSSPHCIYTFPELRQELWILSLTNAGLYWFQETVASNHRSNPSVSKSKNHWPKSAHKFPSMSMEPYSQCDRFTIYFENLEKKLPLWFLDPTNHRVYSFIMVPLGAT